MKPVEVIGIDVSYGAKKILETISLHVEKGEILGIIGPNGAGKTTLIKAMSRIVAPENGEIHLNDRNLDSFSFRELAQKIAVVPQGFSISFDYTVRDVVMMGRARSRRVARLSPPLSHACRFAAGKCPSCRYQSSAQTACRPCWFSSSLMLSVASVQGLLPAHAWMSLSTRAASLPVASAISCARWRSEKCSYNKASTGPYAVSGMPGGKALRSMRAALHSGCGSWFCLVNACSWSCLCVFRISTVQLNCGYFL